MTNKPEVVAYRRPEDGATLDAAWMNEYCDDYTQPLIRLTDHERLQAEAERLQADHEASRAADKARIAELELLLSDAAQEIEDWGAYAPEYFQEKHDLAGVVARFRAALSQPKEESE